MFFGKYSKKKRAYVARKRGGKRVAGRKSSSVSVAVKRFVKNSIHRQIENKTVSEKNEISFGSYNFQPDMSVRPLGPDPGSLVIPQGVGQGERTGNTITTRRLNLKYILYPIKQDDAVNPQPMPQEVMIWIGFLKGARVISPSASSYSLFFNNGSTTSAPYSNLWDCMLPVNTDLFTICKTFRHKIGNEVYSDYGGIKPNNYFSNNDFKLNSTNSVNLTKYINKVIKFVDSGTQCDTGLYMWMTAVNADGTDSVTSSRAIGMRYVLDYQYEDA